MKAYVNAYDPVALKTALKKVQQFAERSTSIRDKVMRKIALEAAAIAYKTYRGAVQVEAEKIEDGYAIVASGERVCFLEFGAGMYAMAHMNALADPKNLGFKVEPGSWSMTEGARTWADWEDRPSEYPYNQPARPGMYEAYKAIKQHFAEWATEAIKNDRY